MEMLVFLLNLMDFLVCFYSYEGDDTQLQVVASRSCELRPSYKAPNEKHFICHKLPLEITEKHYGYLPSHHCGNDYAV